MADITDKQRLDFLQNQSFTKWVGYDLPKKKGFMKGHTAWPVFGDSRQNLREEIDRAINSAKEI